MTTLDAEFLLLEDETSHMHIAGISTFANPAPTFEEVTALAASKLHLIPRYRQRVRTGPTSWAGRLGWTTPPSTSSPTCATRRCPLRATTRTCAGSWGA